MASKPDISTENVVDLITTKKQQSHEDAAVIWFFCIVSHSFDFDICSLSFLPDEGLV